MVREVVKVVDKDITLRMYEDKAMVKETMEISTPEAEE